MKITKLGHCCLLIKEGELTILTDPGNYSTTQNEVKFIDVVLITHEHADHFHLDSLKKVLQNNPKAEVVTNRAVGALLAKEAIDYKILEHGERLVVKDVVFEGFGNDHAVIYQTFPLVQNTGYFIANRFFYPGDAFTNPRLDGQAGKPVEILALPVTAPWLKFSEAMDYALAVKPKICFPVHDGNSLRPGLVERMPPTILDGQGIKFQILEIGQEYSL